MTNKGASTTVVNFHHIRNIVMTLYLFSDVNMRYYLIYYIIYFI